MTQIIVGPYRYRFHKFIFKLYQVRIRIFDGIGYVSLYSVIFVVYNSFSFECGL